MVRKIGKFIALIFLCNFVMGRSSAQDADVSMSMRLLDQNGDAIRQAAVGVPFVVEIVMSGKFDVVEGPDIKGLQSLVVENKTHVSTINSVMNGTRTTKKIFRYSLRADERGNYIIGPAYSIVDHKRIQSSTLTVLVGPQQITGSEQPFVRLIVDKNRVLVGEKIACSVRFYPGKAAGFEGMAEPNFSGFSASKLEGPFTGAEAVDGILRSYVEWRTTLYPEKTGTITIPAIVAVCRMERKRPSTFDLFDHFFDSGLEQKQIYSNVLTLQVDALPPYAGKVHGVGTFTQLRAELDHASAREGEGIVVRLVLEGEGNFAAIDSIELSLPVALKYYDSKQYVADDTKKHAQQRKIFEYIVQGTKPGTWEIPPQTFTYFDVSDRTYKQLSSNQLALTITPLGAHQQPAPGTQDSDQDSLQPSSDQEIMGLAPGQQVQESPNRMIPIRWFLLLLAIPCAVAFGMYAQRYHKQYRQKNATVIFAKRAFKQARSRLKKSDGNASMLYDLFVELFAQRCMVEGTHVSDSSITQALRDRGCSSAFLAQWQLFFNELLQGKFGSVVYDEKKRKALQAQAEYWVDALQKIL